MLKYSKIKKDRGEKIYMNISQEIMVYFIDIVKKYCIILCTYILILKLTNKKINFTSKFIISIFLMIITIIAKELKDYFGFMYYLITNIIILTFIVSKTMQFNYSFSIIITIFSLSINYVIFLSALVIVFNINIFIKIENEWINLIFIILLYYLILQKVLNIRKFKQGLIFLKTKFKNEYLNIILLNISITVLFCYIVLINYNKDITRSFLFPSIFFSIMLFITIKESLQMYYKHNLLVQDLEETKKELEDKKNEIAELEKEILESNKRSHTIAHKQRALEHKIEKLMYNSEIAEEIDLKERLNNIIVKDKKESIELLKSGVELIDDMLEYMQSECIKNKIDFQLKLSGNIYNMVNNYIEPEDLETLIADHIKDAIIAIQNCDSENKSILVRLGKIDGEYGLYVYDSGIEFEKDTLSKLGKEPITTHKDSGGTGMGFMNTFDTLNKYKASLVIKEIGKPVKDNFTKVIMIKFDNKNEFKIKSYREKEFEIISK